MAYWNKDCDLIGLLLSRPNIDEKLGSPTACWNPLLLAAVNHARKSIGLLLQHPHMNKEYRDWSGFTAIHRAALSGNIVSLKALLQGGIDSNVGDRQNGKPLQRAIDYDQFAAVKILLVTLLAMKEATLPLSAFKALRVILGFLAVLLMLVWHR
jgi:ankyrin repeat protein